MKAINAMMKAINTYPEPWEWCDDDLPKAPSPAPLPVPQPTNSVPQPAPKPPIPAPSPAAPSYAAKAPAPRAYPRGRSKKSVKAIRTRYNGYIFRSKLEACWAIFFDAAGIRYIYEQEGYEQEWSNNKYLPDFYLPDLDFHVEVKPERPDYEREILRTRDFIVWGGPIKRLLILTDVPPKTDDGGMWHFPCYVYNASHGDHADGEVSARWFFFWDFDECGVLGNISNASYVSPPINKWDLERKEFSIAPMSDRKIPRIGEKPDWADMDEACGSGYNYRANKLTFKALEIAREVQFDHGQTPTRDEVQRRVYEDKE